VIGAFGGRRSCCCLQRCLLLDCTRERRIEVAIDCSKVSFLIDDALNGLDGLEAWSGASRALALISKEKLLGLFIAAFLTTNSTNQTNVQVAGSLFVSFALFIVELL
jgi:hypothetical protein